MLLPLSLIKCAQNSAMLIELKSGETYNGHLVSVDTFMNIHIRDAICTSKDGDVFHRVPEIFIRGTSIKVFRVSPEAMTKLREDSKNMRQNQRQNKQFKKQMHRGGGAPRGGGGRGGGGGGNHGQKRPHGENGDGPPTKSGRGTFQKRGGGR
uniref:U6 snRNA-associated Sm-like protein LSm4 n=1 Tax=Panagrolaimus sp. PS1159 TaxID=55785 RepID=A0AC35F6Q5_9BILA